MDRMDENFEFRGYQEAPLLKKKPSEYVASPNIFVSCEPEERLLPETMRIIGEDSVIYASDWPHWDGSYPESLFELEVREDLSPQQIQKDPGRQPQAPLRTGIRKSTNGKEWTARNLNSDCHGTVKCAVPRMLRFLECHCPRVPDANSFNLPHMPAMMKKEA